MNGPKNSTFFSPLLSSLFFTGNIVVDLKLKSYGKFSVFSLRTHVVECRKGNAEKKGKKIRETFFFFCFLLSSAGLWLTGLASLAFSARSSHLNSAEKGPSICSGYRGLSM